MIKAILFDVDGVITNSEGVHFKTFKKVLMGYNFDLDNAGYEKWFSGKSTQSGISSILKDTDLKIDVDAFMKEKTDMTLDIFKKEGITFINDTLDFIRHVKRGNIILRGIGMIKSAPALAMVTGLRRVYIDSILEQGNLRDTFQTIVTVEDYTNSKPSPDCYKLALEKMNVLPQESIGIEDTLSGIRALNGAKIFSIGITTTHNAQELSEANLVSNSLMDLIES